MRIKHDPPPSSTAEHGRDVQTGRFLQGNKAARGGSPLAVKALRLRAVLLDEVSERDWRRMIRAMVKRAVRGDQRCFAQLANRLIGKPATSDQREPVQVLIAAESILADRVDAIRSLRLAHARGEALDIEPAEDAFMSARERLDANPPQERRRILKEIDHE